MTAKALADAIGVAETRVSEWVNDSKKPGMESLRLLSFHLNVSIDFLVHGPRAATAAERAGRAADAYRAAGAAAKRAPKKKAEGE